MRAEAQRKPHRLATAPACDLLRYNLQTVRAYLLKEDFQQFWNYDSPRWAGMFLDFWCSQTMRGRIEPMEEIARALREHRALPLNYFKARKEFSSGVVEGLNNKAKITMRRSVRNRQQRDRIVLCVEQNPVSAGLAASAEQWEWSSAGGQAAPPAPPEILQIH